MLCLLASSAALGDYGGDKRQVALTSHFLLDPSIVAANRCLGLPVPSAAALVYGVGIIDLWRIAYLPGHYSSTHGL